jgi:galactokinase
MKLSELKQRITSGGLDSELIHLYGKDTLDTSKQRYLDVLDQAINAYGDEDGMLFSAPGRTEVGGNHTDHQQGRVLAASISLDIISAVIPTVGKLVEYQSGDFKVKPVDLHDLEIQPSENNTTESLIRGIGAWYHQKGYEIGGFKMYAESRVLPGSGMSSSAAFETLIGTVMDSLYCRDEVDAVEIAKAGQYAENVYFGKASGLMDQMACSVGGFVTIDFKDKENPIVKKVDYDFEQSGHVLILTDCKQSHADLSDEYSRIPNEMKAAAKVMGHEVLSECTMDQLIEHAAEIRNICGDRAFLRAYHFMNETDRVVTEVNALNAQKFDEFLELVKESGRSSYMYLQNVYPPADRMHQSLAVGLALSEQLLNGRGAFRVHGGGFAGTIQAFVPNDLSEAYQKRMESVFGQGCCYVLQIRAEGGIKIA